jgi:hypothetical protein
MLNYSALVWIFFLTAMFATWFFCRLDRRASTLSIGIGVTGWVLDSQSGYDFLAYGLQILSAILAILFVLPRERKSTQDIRAKVFHALQRMSYLFVAAQIVSTLISNSGPEGVIRALLLAVLIATFNSYCGKGKTQVDLPLIISTIAVLTTIIDSLFSITQVSLTEIGGGRSGGIIGHPNYAAYLGAAVCVVWYTKKQDVISTPAFFLTGLATVITLSRTAILALALALLLVSLQKKKKVQATMLSILVIVAGLIQSSFADTILERFGWIASSGGLLGSNSSGWRALQWARTIEVIADRQLNPVGWKQSGQHLLSGLEPHNYYLQSLLELGVLGLACSIGFTVIFVRSQARLKNFGPAAIVALGSIFDAGLLVPSFFIGALVMLMSSARSDSDVLENISSKRLKIRPQARKEFDRVETL